MEPLLKMPFETVVVGVLVGLAAGGMEPSSITGVSERDRW